MWELKALYYKIFLTTAIMKIYTYMRVFIVDILYMLCK